MKKGIYILILMTSFWMTAQEASSSVEKQARVQTLQDKLSVPVFNAYKENSAAKVEDLFHYFELLTDKDLNKETKDEIIINIGQLFNNFNQHIIDFTSDNGKKIKLETLIQKLLVSEPLSFKVIDAKAYDAFSYNSWQSSYTVAKTQSGQTKNINVTQVMYLFETTKAFGKNRKVVWASYLGDMK